MKHIFELWMTDYIAERHSQLLMQLKQLRKESLKKSGLNGIRTHDL